MLWRLLPAVVLLESCLVPSAITARTNFFGMESELLTHSRELLLGPGFDPETLVSPKIFKGINVQRARFECMVSLRKPSSNVHYCGGILILPNVVATAAHCMDSGFSEQPGAEDDDESKGGFSQPNPIAYIGGSRVDVDDPDAEAIPSCSTIVHSDWTGRLLGGNDIALIKLQYASKKVPCPVYQGEAFSTGQNLTALGWGQTEFESFAPTLQKVQNLVFESLDDCNADDKWFGNILPGMLCADGPNGEDTCDGDSGGPLLLEGSILGNDQVAGITSFGHIAGCGNPGQPGVYTDLLHHGDWIERQGAGLSRVYQVPFCGNPNPGTGNPADDIAASIANNDVPNAVSAIARSYDAGELAAIEAAVQSVSRAGLAENVIKALVSAVNNGTIDEEAATTLMQEATKRLPPADAQILSGVVKSQLKETLYKDLAAGNVEAVHAGIVHAFSRARADDVLQAVSSAFNDGNGLNVAKCLNHTVARGVNPADLAVALAPICVGMGEDCHHHLLEPSYNLILSDHSAAQMNEWIPETESAWSKRNSEEVELG